MVTAQIKLRAEKEGVENNRRENMAWGGDGYFLC